MRTLLVLAVLACSALAEVPAVLQMLQLGGSSDKSTSPWHLSHHFLGHHFNGSLQANITMLSEEDGNEVWQVGSLFGADTQDREWEYTVTCNRKKIGVEKDPEALAQPIQEELQFELSNLRYFNRQSETFEDEEHWSLKKIGGKKKSVKKGQGINKRVVESFPPQKRTFLFTEAVTLSSRNGGGVPEGTPTIVYGTTPDVSLDSTQKIPIQLSLENSQNVPEARSLTLIVGSPENLETDDEEEEQGSRRRGSDSASAGLNSRQLLKDKVEVYYFSGTSVRKEQGFFGSSNFMLIMMLGFFGFRTWSSFKDARKKIELEATKKKQ